MCVLDIWGQLIFHPASAQRAAPGHMDVQLLIDCLKGMGNACPLLTAEATGKKSQPPGLAPTRQFLKAATKLKELSTLGPRF